MNADYAPVALVTGATSGFGHAIAAALHERGWVVYGTTRSEALHRPRRARDSCRWM